MFHNDDPCADPPEEWTKVGDVNTGLAYRKTHEALIKPNPESACGRKRVLVGVQFYFDATVTRHFGNLPLSIFKFTLCILKGKTRNQDWAWRALGYVRKILKRGRRAEQNLKKSNHTDSKNFVRDPTHQRKQFPQAARAGPEHDWELHTQGSTANGGRRTGGRKKKPLRRKTS